MPAKRSKTTPAKAKRASRPSRAELDRLLEEATVDCYDEDEELTSLFTVLEDDLELPFKASLLGEEVTVTGLRLGRRLMIEARCRRGGQRQAVDLLSLKLPSPPPAGAKWIHAYEHWASRR